MTIPIPTFGDLQRVLIGLGFEDRSVPDSHALLEHRSSDTVVLLRPYRQAENLDPATFLGIRRILDEKGVIAQERLDDLLRQCSLAG